MRPSVGISVDGGFGRVKLTQAAGCIPGDLSRRYTRAVDTNSRSRGSTISGWLPWVIYFPLANVGWPHTAALAAFATIAIFTVVPAIRGARVKLIDWTTLGFFTLAVISALAGGAAANAFKDWSMVLVWLMFAAVAWTSIALGAPFTLQYARETTPPESWTTPQFLALNRFMSLVWAGLFSVNLAIVLSLTGARGALRWVAIGVPMALVVGGFIFTARYSAAVRRRAQTAPAQSSAH